jgi:hypothetical protein
MDKKTANEILVSALGILSAEAEMEAIYAKAHGISRNKYNKMIEEGLELPECIKKYRELNRKRQYYEEKIIKNELRERGELEPNPALAVVFLLFPQFQQDYEIMKNGYITETETGLKWEKSIQSLAEYFGKLPLPQNRKTRPWKDIEILFNVKDLKNSFSNNGNSYGKKISKDYEELQKKLPRNIPKGK